MMIMPTPSAELFRATASASALAVTTEEKSLKNIQQGFISCVKKISNSLVTMKDAVVEGYHRLTVCMKPSSAKAPASTLNETSIDPKSGAGTGRFCQEVKQRIADNPDCKNRMFLKNPAMTYDKFAQQLKNHNDLWAAIKNGQIDDADAGSLISGWMELSINKNKFSAGDCKKLVANKGNRNEIARIFNGKFNTSDANALENRNKLISLLLLTQAYEGLYASNSDVKNLQQLAEVVEYFIIPQIFDLDTHQAPSSPAPVRRRHAMREAHEAFRVLMDNCPSAVPPGVDLPRSH